MSPHSAWLNFFFPPLSRGARDLSWGNDRPVLLRRHLSKFAAQG
jgi:hypothetical protein